MSFQSQPQRQSISGVYTIAAVQTTQKIPNGQPTKVALVCGVAGKNGA